MDEQNLIRGMEQLLGFQAGITVVLASLIAKHPDHDQLQLHITTALETALADQGPWQMLSETQKAAAREYVEGLQRTAAARGAIRPLGGLSI